VTIISCGAPAGGPRRLQWASGYRYGKSDRDLDRRNGTAHVVPFRGKPSRGLQRALNLTSVLIDPRTSLAGIQFQMTRSLPRHSLVWLRDGAAKLKQRRRVRIARFVKIEDCSAPLKRDRTVVQQTACDGNRAGHTLFTLRRFGAPDRCNSRRARLEWPRACSCRNGCGFHFDGKFAASDQVERGLQNERWRDDLL